MFLVLVMQKRLGSGPLFSSCFLSSHTLFLHREIYLHGACLSSCFGLFLFLCVVGKENRTTAGNFSLQEGMKMGRKQIGFFARVLRMAFSKHWLLLDDGYDFHLFLATLMALFFFFFKIQRLHS